MAMCHSERNLWMLLAILHQKVQRKTYYIYIYSLSNEAEEVVPACVA